MLVAKGSQSWRHKAVLNLVEDTHGRNHVIVIDNVLVALVTL